MCNGDGISDDECDCEGNVLDDCGVCGGSGVDEDTDGICDDVDPCVGEYDECGVCNGQNLNKDCNGDCFGDAVIDDCNVCSGGNTNHEFNSDLDQCDICFGENQNLDCNNVCFGDGIDSDNDGICDDIDDCDGIYDECGICNGDGTWCLEGHISFGSLTETHLDILYDSPLDIGGYQFSVTGIDIINAYGGISGESGFNIANNNDTVIAFSPTNSLIPSGSGVLVILTINYLLTESCFNDVVVSDNDGDEINFNLGICIENIPCDDNDNDTICDEIDDCIGEYDDCGVCGGSGVDEDTDGICDDVDPCVGEYDECGECNGDGISDDECDCEGNVLDDCGVCGGSGVDEDTDGICDDVDPCVGEYDECGECNGDGISDDECDCEGNVLDDCGVCGGSGVDEDTDGICDDVDPCVGEYDECGECNGDGISDDECDCEGNVLDDCGVCGGSGVDEDTDGICDDVDPCVGEYDECGECNGDGISDDECDCEGNVLDDCGVCGGSGVDEDTDGICDDVDPCVGEYDECGECNGDGSSCLENFIIEYPSKFYLSFSYPNPFNPVTTFNYGVPEHSNIKIIIYNSVGQVISTPINYFHTPGNYTYTWNASNYSNGVYYFQLISNQLTITRKATLLK